MRFLLSSHGASPFGAERVLLAVAAGLTARGHAVTLELPHDGPAVGSARAAGIHVVVSGRARLPRNALELARYGAGFASSVRSLRTLLRSERYDVLWVNSIYNVPAAVAARGAGVPVVWHLHERNFGGPAARIAAHCVQRHSDLAVAPSGFVADSFIAAGLPQHHVRIVPNALLRLARPSPRPARDRFVIGYIGQLERRKRVTDILGAVARIDGSSALLVGDGKARRTVQASIAELHLADRVRLAGFQEDVMPFLDACDCVVIPSPDEAFGLVAVEAMAAGRPVVAARSGALPEVLGDAAAWFPVGDTAALAACIAALRADPARAAELSARGIERAGQYSVERLLDGVEQVAHEAVHGRRGARTEVVRA